MKSGIYKITSPSGHVYIGQSVNIEKRWKFHYYNKNNKTPIVRSLNKHGYTNHYFNICHELPTDATKETFCQYEQLYIDLYRDAGVVLLNANPASYSMKGFKHTDEFKRNSSEIRKGWKSPMEGKKHTPESISKIKAARALQTNVKGKTKGAGIKKVKKEFNLEEKKKKCSENNAKYWLGKKMTYEQKRVLSDSHKGVFPSEETKKKRSESMKLVWAKRKSV